MEAMENLCGDTEYGSTIAVGKKLSKIAPLLDSRDGIKYENTKPDNRTRGHKFTVERF